MSLKKEDNDTFSDSLTALNQNQSLTMTIHIGQQEKNTKLP